MTYQEPKYQSRWLTKQVGLPRHKTLVHDNTTLKKVLTSVTAMIKAAITTYRLINRLSRRPTALSRSLKECSIDSCSRWISLRCAVRYKWSRETESWRTRKIVRSLRARHHHCHLYRITWRPHRLPLRKGRSEWCPGRPYSPCLIYGRRRRYDGQAKFMLSETRI